MKARILLAGVVLVTGATALAQTTVDVPESVVQFGLFMIQPNGSVGGSAKRIAWQVGEEISGSLYLGTCSYGAGPVPASATDVWQLSGKVLAIGAEEASVQIAWQRLRRGGRDESPAPPSPATLTLRRGSRVRLERNALPPGSCGEGYVALEVAFVDRDDRAREADSLERAAENMRTAAQDMAARLRSFVGTADLWLIRSTPGRPDETLHVGMSYGREWRAFSFPPISIQTPAGALNVKVDGALGVDESQLHFHASRGVTFAPSDRPARDPKPQVEGSTNTTVALPTPNEVLSFEMPPLRVPGGAAVPDRLSIRVRLTPAPVKKK